MSILLLQHFEAYLTPDSIKLVSYKLAQPHFLRHLGARAICPASSNSRSSRLLPLASWEPRMTAGSCLGHVPGWCQHIICSLLLFVVCSANTYVRSCCCSTNTYARSYCCLLCYIRSIVINKIMFIFLSSTQPAAAADLRDAAMPTIRINKY